MRAKRWFAILLFAASIIGAQVACGKGGACLSDNPSDCNPSMVATIQAAPTQCVRDSKGNCK